MKWLNEKNNGLESDEKKIKHQIKKKAWLVFVFQMKWLNEKITGLESDEKKNQTSNIEKLKKNDQKNLK